MNHLYFLFLRFGSNIYCKINFTAKNGSDLCDFYGKLEFWILFFIIISSLNLLLVAEFQLLNFDKNIEKFQIF